MKEHLTLLNLIKQFYRDYIFRSRILIALSIILDSILTIYYLYNCFIYPLNYCLGGLAIWYLLLTIINFVLFLLFIKYKNEQKRYLLEMITAIFIFVIGLVILIFSIIMYDNRIAFSWPNSTLYINGSIVATLLFTFLGRKYYRQQSIASSFYRCKKYISRIEGLFSLILIFQKVIGFFKWENNGILTSLLMCEIAIFIYSLVLSITLLYLARKNKF